MKKHDRARMLVVMKGFMILLDVVFSAAGRKE